MTKTRKEVNVMKVNNKVRRIEFNMFTSAYIDI